GAGLTDDTSQNLIANNTNANTGAQLATTRIITDDPISMVRVLVNGVEMRIGSNLATYDCYFSPDGNAGTIVRATGEEVKGDYLFWNTNFTDFQLENSDRIDYVYLTVLSSETSGTSGTAGGANLSQTDETTL
ncbi:MAG: hypothetical protein ACC656_09640, partial [Candidatus Heimdallarchaeota archaeon]